MDELVATIRGSRKLRAVGAAHSWSPAIVTDDTLVSLERMRRVLRIDRERMQVTVEAGMRLRELNRVLDSHGLALPQLGSIDSQAIGGIIATGTHGSGGRFRCISAQVARLELVDGRGDRVTLQRGDPDFAGAVVALGAVGITYAVTFDVVEAFRLHDRTCLEPFEDVIEAFDAHVADNDHFKVWWLPPDERAIVYRYRRTAEAANDGAVRRFVKERVLSVGIYRVLLALGQLRGRRHIPRINRFLTNEAGRPLDRRVASHIGFLTPLPPVHRETEWAFDLADARPLLREYRRLLPDGGHTYNFIQELRVSAADDLWLSPAYQRDTLWLSVYNVDRRSWPAQLAKFEAFARAHGGRPHWGKEATFDRAYLRAQYPRFDDFVALARRYDPEGKFRNAWLEELL